MEEELRKFIGELESKKRDKKDPELPMEPRNFNWHFKGNFGDETTKHRQAQVSDIVNEQINKNNNWDSFDIRQLEEHQERAYGQNRKFQHLRGYTDKVELTRYANADFSEYLNILQPRGQEHKLSAQLDVTGQPVRQTIPTIQADKPEGKQAVKTEAAKTAKKKGNFLNQIKKGFNKFKDLEGQLSEQQREQIIGVAGEAMRQAEAQGFSPQQIGQALENLIPENAQRYIPMFQQIFANLPI